MIPPFGCFVALRGTGVRPVKLPVAHTSSLHHNATGDPADDRLAGGVGLEVPRTARMSASTSREEMQVMTTSDIGYTPVLPEGWQRPRGFSHAVVASGTKSVRIAGQIGREPGQAHIPAGTDAGTQWKVALGNVVAVLKAAGGQPTHL